MTKMNERIDSKLDDLKKNPLVTQIYLQVSFSSTNCDWLFI